MFKKRIWKPLLITLGWTLSLAGLVVLMSFIGVKKAEVICKEIKVYIPGNHYFIDRQEVDHILQMDSRTLIGRRMEMIDIHALENKLKHNPFIESAKVFMDMDGIMQVEVSQRQPILRVMNQFNQDFYVDQHGLKIPLSQNFTARVIAANGFIGELFAGNVDSLHSAMAKQLYKTAEFIRKDSLWDAQIAQIYVNKDQDIELIPRVGNQRILLGNADSLELKFGNLAAFYKQAIPMVGWDAYKIINIKYSNQVIGVKNQTLVDSLNAAKEIAKKAAAESARAAAVNKTRASRDTVTIPLPMDDTERPTGDKGPVIPEVPNALAKPVTHKPINTAPVKKPVHTPLPKAGARSSAAKAKPKVVTPKKKEQKKNTAIRLAEKKTVKKTSIKK